MGKMSIHNTDGTDRVAVYARFSCDKQRDASIEDQVNEAQRYCDTHGYEIVKVYPDYAISGRSDDRPQFLQMINDAQEGAFDVVLVWKIDRFARNMQDQYYYEKVLANAGVRLESVKENIAGNGIEASLSKGMLAIFAQLRSQQGSEDVMRGMLGKARECKYLGYQWFGYTHDGDEIILDEATAPIAHEIHSRYLRGEAVKDIVTWLDGLGVRGRGNKPIGYTFVTGILKNMVYAGVYTWGKAKDERGNVRLDADGLPVPLVRVEGGIPAIVTMDEKEGCLKRLKFRKHINAKVDYLLSGKLFCPECGNPMHGETCTNHAGVEFLRYCCQGKRKACNGVYWKEATERTVAKAIRAMLEDPETVEILAQRFAAFRSNRKPKASIEAAKADLKSVIKQRDNLIKAVEDGMPYKHVEDKIEKLDAQQEGIERKIEKLSHAEREISKADVMEYLHVVAKGALTDEEIIKSFVSQVWVYDDQAIAVMNFFGKTSTPYEIQWAYETARTSSSKAGSCNSSMVRPVGIEPTTVGLEVRCSIR